MAGKLFIVAKGNVAVYESLRRSVGAEPGVAIIYDRRVTPASRRRAPRFLGPFHGPGAPRRLEPSPERPPVDRRQQNAVESQIRQRGWAVVRRDQSVRALERDHLSSAPPTQSFRPRGHATGPHVRPPSVPPTPRAQPEAAPGPESSPMAVRLPDANESAVPPALPRPTRLQESQESTPLTHPGHGTAGDDYDLDTGEVTAGDRLPDPPDSTREMERLLVHDTIRRVMLGVVSVFVLLVVAVCIVVVILF